MDPDYIFNPQTDRWVLKSGKVGRALMEADDEPYSPEDLKMMGPLPPLDVIVEAVAEHSYRPILCKKKLL